MTTHTETGPAGLERALGWAAAAGTVPYLALKGIWLFGGHAGVADPALLADPSVLVLNVVTAVMDLLVIVLALALVYPWGRRLPAWTLLLPVWVGTGFLAPMAIAVVPGLLLEASEAPPATMPQLESWVQPMVYSGFAWQGVFLIAAFVLHARRRWDAAVRVPGAPSGPLGQVLAVVAVGGMATAAVSALLRLVDGVASGTASGAFIGAVHAGLGVAAIAGMIALVKGRAERRWLAVGGVFAGSAAPFSWGLWAAVTMMGTTVFDGTNALAGMAGLSGLLGGFALAVAGLLALVTPLSERRS
ncbi:hypothetical protein [Pseudonocardia sp. TRM90224]|uniref:hypothetical protein n=1 Tax=Pseudonocardia sp. TRM90224 TaxID=2812678 RepID=UPI001E58A20F|nr:hypothetical protein [Pseudonocardia sp. TRM90224]